MLHRRIYVQSNVNGRYFKRFHNKDGKSYEIYSLGKSNPTRNLLNVTEIRIMCVPFSVKHKKKYTVFCKIIDINDKNRWTVFVNCISLALL